MSVAVQGAPFVLPGWRSRIVLVLLLLGFGVLVAREVHRDGLYETLKSNPDTMMKLLPSSEYSNHTMLNGTSTTGLTLRSSRSNCPTLA